MIKCPKCGKEIEDDMDFCYHCGKVINGNAEIFKENIKNDEGNQKSTTTNAHVLNEDYIENGGNYVDEGSSIVGKMIKTLSIVVLVLSVIGSFVIMGELGAPIGIASLIVSVLTSLLAYGIGEIICVLREINTKIK
ncbi:MAG: zinc ribbon domain-containing protein [Lachnospiraceae bacterium]|nr:zinc ribbon domain-containing protein [Lachnospiraceae bacterium]